MRIRPILSSALSPGTSRGAPSGYSVRVRAITSAKLTSIHPEADLEPLALASAALPSRRRHPPGQGLTNGSTDPRGGRRAPRAPDTRVGDFPRRDDLLAISCGVPRRFGDVPQDEGCTACRTSREAAWRAPTICYVFPEGTFRTADLQDAPSPYCSSNEK